MPIRICRKCLTKDMQKGEYFSNLHQYIENIDADLKIDETGYEQRLSVCKTCDLLEDAMCRGCGCFVELRGS